MSDEDRGVQGSGDGSGNSTRVGTAERDEAVALLAEHWHAGRLDPSEHELRVTRARAAVTRADLDVLFADLPQPVPAATPPPDSVVPGPVSGSGTGGVIEGKRDTIMALTPFAALLLFFTTGSWLWFLLIPVMGIVLYGAGGKKTPPDTGRT
jgi:Domain of unknown function (DUF1707)